MRLFTKIFLFGMLVFGLAFSASGYFLLHDSLETSMAREADFALKQFQYDKFTVQSAMLTYSEVSIVMGGEDNFSAGETGKLMIWRFSPEGEAVPDGGHILEGEPALGGEMLPWGEPALRGEALPWGESALGGEMLPWGEPALRGEAFPWGEPALGGEALPWGENLPDGHPWNVMAEQFFRGIAEQISVPAAFYAEDKTPIYSEIEGLDTSFLDSLSEDKHIYRFRDTPEDGAGGRRHGGAVLVGTVLDWNVPWTAAGIGNGEAVAEPSENPAENKVSAMADTSVSATADTSASATADAMDSRRIYFVTQWDISKTIGQQDTLRQHFVRCYLAAAAMGMVLLGILSALLTGPLKRMSIAARRMAEGCYEERLGMRGSDEIGELAASFNQMADAVEEKIGELSKAAREKEDFVANFAHELKTPLTSIIGYADTIYQKDMPRENVRKASWHIWNEGMRLETLSLKLMELTVLGRQEFPLQEMSAEELLRDVAESMTPVFLEKQIDFVLQAEEAYINVDCDLLKTLLLNLLDNSIKAGGRRLEVSGHRCGGRYRIRVRDDGCGMEEAELSRITEAFYMVDKARSRKQHGAGLGLALADRIAGIHGSGLSFRSRKGAGTEVFFDVECGKGVVEDEEI